MKILHKAVFILLFCAAIIPAYSSGVLCTSNNNICAVGGYTMYGQNLYANDGIVCTSSKTICTNGYSVLKTSGVVYKQSDDEKVINTEKDTKKDIIQISEAEKIAKYTELYKKGLITQIEFNKLKKSSAVTDINKSEELNNLAKLYEKGLITQIEFNRKKAELF